MSDRWHWSSDDLEGGFSTRRKSLRIQPAYVLSISNPQSPITIVSRSNEMQTHFFDSPRQEKWKSQNEKLTGTLGAGYSKERYTGPCPPTSEISSSQWACSAGRAGIVGAGLIQYINSTFVGAGLIQCINSTLALSMVSVAAPPDALSKDGLASALSSEGSEGSQPVRQIKPKKKWNAVVERREDKVEIRRDGCE